MSNEKFSFSFRLLEHIRLGLNQEVKSMLNKQLVKSFNRGGTLLHHAVRCGNAIITRHLIEMESDIDALDTGGKTSLMLAVECGNVQAIKVLLEAGADINIVNDTGKSVLHVVFDANYWRCDVIKVLIDRLQSQTNTTERFVEKLIELGASLYHAACSRDIQVMKSMLDRGIDVNSRHRIGSTALHAAVILNDLDLATWLVDNGATVNSFDQFEQTPLYIAASNGKKAILQFLLERGADPNMKSDSWLSPLFATFAYPGNRRSMDQYIDCTECLLQNGAIPENPMLCPNMMFELALFHSSDKRLQLLTAHLAMLEMLGTAMTKSMISCKQWKNQLKTSDYGKYYQQCQKILTIVMFDHSSFLDLLNADESKMKLLVRNETFTSKIKEVCNEHKLSELYPYYHNTLVKEISKAAQIVELEETTIAIICQLLQGDVNVYYHFVRKVISYLSKNDLEQLLRVEE